MRSARLFTVPRCAESIESLCNPGSAALGDALVYSTIFRCRGGAPGVEAVLSEAAVTGWPAAAPTSSAAPRLPVRVMVGCPPVGAATISPLICKWCPAPRCRLPLERPSLCGL